MAGICDTRTQTEACVPPGMLARYSPGYAGPNPGYCEQYAARHARRTWCHSMECKRYVPPSVPGTAAASFFMAAMLFLVSSPAAQ